VDALEANDRDHARQLAPAEKLAEALETMRVGIRLKRSALRRQFAQADDREIERRLMDWLETDG
jgi:hypothetical protein